MSVEDLELPPLPIEDVSSNFSDETKYDADIEEIKDDVKEEDFKDEVKEEVKVLVEEVKEEVKALVEEVKDEIKEEVKALVEEVKEEVKAVVEEVKEEIKDEIKDEIKAVVEEGKEDEAIAEIKEELKTMLKLNFHTSRDVIKMVSLGITCVEKYNNMSGKQKKELVIESVKDVILNSDIPDAEQEKLKLIVIISVVADPIVDALVDFGNDVVLFVKSKLSKFIAKLSKCLKIKAPKCLKASESEPSEDNVIDELTKFVSELAVNETKVIVLLSHAVKFMAKYNLTGSAKKRISLNAIRAVIRTHDKFSDTERQEALVIVDTIGSEFIDTAVTLGKSNFQSN